MGFGAYEHGKSFTASQSQLRTNERPSVVLRRAAQNRAEQRFRRA